MNFPSFNLSSLFSSAEKTPPATPASDNPDSTETATGSSKRGTAFEQVTSDSGKQGAVFSEPGQEVRKGHYLPFSIEETGTSSLSERNISVATSKSDKESARLNSAPSSQSAQDVTLSNNSSNKRVEEISHSFELDEAKAPAIAMLHTIQLHCNEALDALTTGKSEPSQAEKELWTSINKEANNLIETLQQAKQPVDKDAVKCIMRLTEEPLPGNITIYNKKMLPGVIFLLQAASHFQQAAKELQAGNRLKSLEEKGTASILFRRAFEKTTFS